MIKSLISAFSMYSRIPMPQIEWKEENRRFALCFFPLIGAVIGGIILLWKAAAELLGIGDFLFGAVCTAIPVFITGGIHSDGFCDVCDAKASYAPREKALEIMSDPHIGAFAAIFQGLYLILETAFFSEAGQTDIVPVIFFVFIMSRTLSGMGAVTLKCAKKDGTLQSFSRPAHRNITVAVLFAMLAGCLCGMICVDTVSGIAGFIGGILVFIYYRSFSYKRFGGITGDLAGYFLQLCELFSIACIIISDKLVSVIG